MQRSRTALVLAGGGVAGLAYEIGAVGALNTFLSRATPPMSVHDFDVYVGTSAGSLLGASLVNAIPPAHLLDLLDPPMQTLDSFLPSHIFTPNLADILHRSLMLPEALLGAAERTIQHIRRDSLIDIAEAFTRSLPTGLYKSTAMERHMREAFSQPGRTNEFRKLSHSLIITACHLDSGELALFGIPPLDEVPISVAICASSAFPPFYRPVCIDGQMYIDGGIRGIARLDAAIEQGAQLIICINPVVSFDNRQYRFGQSLNEQGAAQIGNQVFRTLLATAFHYHLDAIRQRFPDVDIILIEPDRHDALIFREHSMRYSSRHILAQHGQRMVSHHLTAHYPSYQPMLAYHGINLPNRPTDDEQSTAADKAPVVASLSETLNDLDRLLNSLD